MSGIAGGRVLQTERECKSVHCQNGAETSGRCRYDDASPQMALRSHSLDRDGLHRQWAGHDRGVQGCFGSGDNVNELGL